MDSEQKRVLLFGGTFNPVHIGHLIVARAMAEQIKANKVCLIPNGHPPHKEPVVSKTHRYEMLKIAVSIDGSYDPLFEISRYEIEKTPPSYTLETVRYFRRTSGDSVKRIYWMIGPDNLLDLVNWYKIEELAKECIFVVGSKKSPTKEVYDEMNTWPFCEDLDIVIAPIPHLDIRSTIVRERIQEGQSIRHYVPDAVEEYIRQHGLYKNIKQPTTV